METKLWPDHYRYFSTLDEDGVHINCQRFVVIGETPCCYYVINETHAGLAGTDWSTASAWRKKLRRRVLKKSGKRYCYPEKEKAFASFVTRQKWRMSHAKRSMSIASLALGKAESMIRAGEIPEALSFPCGHDDYTSSLIWDC